VLSQQWVIGDSADEGLVVNGPHGRVYIHNDVADSPDSHILMLDYSGGAELIKKVLEVIADDPEVVVENDFGTALPGNEFVARLRSDPNWEWRV